MYVIPKFLVHMLQYTENQVLYLFFPLEYEKALSKVGYFIKIAKNFNTVLTAQLTPKQQKNKSHLIVYSTWDWTYLSLQSYGS